MATDTAETKPLEVYAMGLCMMSVCVDKDLPVEEVERLANLEMPTGISSRWEISDEPFSGDEPNPSPCNSRPDSRVHRLLDC